MPWFRQPSASACTALTTDSVRQVIADAVAQRHFLVHPDGTRWEHVSAQEISWEVFRNRLLDAAHTRQRRVFEAWNVWLFESGERSGEPLIAVKFDTATNQVHVVRAIHCHAWEAYDSGGNVILSRETKKWVRELVGTIELAHITSVEEFRDELIAQLFNAVVGSSRLPLTSVEAPLPGFTLGDLVYCYQSGADQQTVNMALCSRDISWRERVKLLEFALRRTCSDGDVAILAQALANRWDHSAGPGENLDALLKAVFNEVSLSPYSCLVANTIRLVQALHDAGHFSDTRVVDFFAHLLRQIGRHLTAYDLVTFHHAGANYPDALLLDEVLGAYLPWIEQTPTLFLGPETGTEANARRLRRRALRSAWLIRQHYRGHRVPDEPTSPGENMRILPRPFARVPDEQITQPHRRSKKLFTEGGPGGGFSPTARRVLRQSVLDLAQPTELRELGMALFLDRPLGMFKAPGEPDLTPLLSYAAFSRTIAGQRLVQLGGEPDLLSAAEFGSYQQALANLEVKGLPVRDVRAVTRPGVVSLTDALKVADDFVILETTAATRQALLRLFDFGPFGRLLTSPSIVIGSRGDQGTNEIRLTVTEAGTLWRCLELCANTADGSTCRAGVEYPRNGFTARWLSQASLADFAIFPREVLSVKEDDNDVKTACFRTLPRV
jgi:hypothetical protein